LVCKPNANEPNEQTVKGLILSSKFLQCQDGWFLGGGSTSRRMLGLGNA